MLLVVLERHVRPDRRASDCALAAHLVPAAEGLCGLGQGCTISMARPDFGRTCFS